MFVINILLLIFSSNSIAAQSCGVQKVGKGLIVGGYYASPGAWPWLGVLRLKRNNQFFCAVSLFTERHALTAAHCIEFKKVTKNLQATEITVSFGIFDLNDSNNTNVVVRDVEQIVVHPEWTKEGENFNADVALLYLKSKVTFNDYIQPICLPLNNGAGILDEGTIVGYGKSENTGSSIFDHENSPKQVNIVAISNELCFLDEPDLARLSSTKTFCAGNRNVGACTGDSGGGFYVLSGRNYVLRGIISSSLLDGKRNCDVRNYAVYTDVSKFMDWIIDNTKRTSKNHINVKAIEVKQWDLQKFECYFVTSNSRYGCDVLLMNYHDNNVKIDETNGKHFQGKTNFDVSYIRAYSKITTYLPNGLGEIFPNLWRLYVGRCGVEYIDRKVFTRMTNLKEIRLSWNEIGDFPEDTLWDLEQLEELDFGGNNIKNLHRNSLANLSKLKKFIFHNNRVERLDLDLFKNNQELEMISFSENRIKIIKGNFDNLSKLSSLSLNKNLCISTDFPDKQTLSDLMRTIESNCRRLIISNLEGTTIWKQRFENSNQ